MKKKFLLLGLSLLICGGSVFAGESDDSKTVINDYEGLKTALKKVESFSKLEDEIAELNKQINLLGNKPDQWVTKTITVKDTNDLYKGITAYFNGIRAKEESNDTTRISFYMDKKNVQIGEKYDPEEDDVVPVYGDVYYLYVTVPSFISEANKLIPNATWKTLSVKTAISGSKEKGEDRNAAKFVKNTETPQKPDKIIFVYKKETTEGNFDIVQKSKTPNSAYYYAYSSLFLDDLEEYIDFNDMYTNDTKTINVENPNYTSWMEDYNEYSGQIKEKRALLEEKDTYKTWTITGPITITDNITSQKTWPAGFYLDGGFNKVEGNATRPLFLTNAGYISNLISDEGRIATEMEGAGSVNHCIVKIDGKNEYYLYDDMGNRTTYTSIVDAVYQMRDSYGYDLLNEKAGKVTPATKLYQAKYTDTTTGDKNEKSFKMNLAPQLDNNGEIVGYDVKCKENYSLDNRFIFVENEAPGLVLTGNVVANGVCDNATIVEGENKPEFYISEGFTANKLNYTRSISTDLASVCLPFSITTDIQAIINEKLGSDIQVYYYNFSKVDPNKNSMYFTVFSRDEATADIPANTPIIMAFTAKPSNAILFDGLTNVSFGATNGLGTISGPENFFGNYKPKQTAALLIGQHRNAGNTAYGFQNGDIVEIANSKLNQFRSYILYDKENLSSNAPKYSITLLDEDGNVVNGIESVKTYNNGDGFKAVGGDNVIEINADEACDVKIYTVSGALVKTVRVEAGSTTLPVNAGMYIVNKNKVVVK